jgi:hypothetical protein
MDCDATLQLRVRGGDGEFLFFQRGGAVDDDRAVGGFTRFVVDVVGEGLAEPVARLSVPFGRAELDRGR